MDDRCVGVLRELVEKYGPAVLGETRRVKGALLDAKIERARVNGIVTVLAEGFLSQSICYSQTPDPMAENRAIRWIEDRLPAKHDFAHWLVETIIAVVNPSFSLARSTPPIRDVASSNQLVESKGNNIGQQAVSPKACVDQEAARIAKELHNQRYEQELIERGYDLQWVQHTVDSSLNTIFIYRKYFVNESQRAAPETKNEIYEIDQVIARNVSNREWSKIPEASARSSLAQQFVKQVNMQIGRVRDAYGYGTPYYRFPYRP